MAVQPSPLPPTHRRRRRSHLRPPAEPIHAESVAVEAPADGSQDVHQADAVAQWTVAPQNVDPSYVNDLLKAIQSQSVSGNPALSSLA